MSDVGAVSWSTAVEGFREWLADGTRSSATREGYLKHLGWLAAGSPCGPWEVTGATLGEWLDGQQWSEQTRRKVLLSVRLFYSWALSRGFLEWSPAAGLATRAPRQRGPERRVFCGAWVEPVGAYLAWKQAAGHSPGTTEQCRWHLGRLADAAADPWAVTGQQLATLLSNPDWSPQTKRCARSRIHDFYRWAVLTGRVDRNPADLLDRVRVPRALPRPAPEDALRRALAVSDDRVRIALMLAGLAGLRRAEVACVHTAQIEPGELVVVGKGGHQRRVPLHPQLKAALTAELERRRLGGAGSGFGCRATVDGWLFPSDHGHAHITAAHLGKLMTAALPDGLTPHTLRHRFATRAYLVERDLRAVQELLGHAKPETTARYAAVPEGALRTAVLGVGV